MPQAHSLMFYHGPYLHSGKPAIKMSSAISNIFYMLVNNSSIFFWKMSPTRAALNGSPMYLYQMDKSKLLNMMTFHLASDYSSLNLHKLV